MSLNNFASRKMMGLLALSMVLVSGCGSSKRLKTVLPNQGNANDSQVSGTGNSDEPTAFPTVTETPTPTATVEPSPVASAAPAAPVDLSAIPSVAPGAPPQGKIGKAKLKLFDDTAMDAVATNVISFDKDIKPVLVKHCVGCHDSSKINQNLCKVWIFGHRSADLAEPLSTAESRLIQDWCDSGEKP